MRWPRHAFCHLLVLAVAPSFGVSREVWVDTTTCAALQKCQLDRECHTCLTAVGPSAGTGLLLWTLPDLENPSVFFAALENNTECAANSTDEMLGAALAELHTSQPCADEVAIYPDKCALAQHTCFQDQNCRECLAGLHNASSGPSVEFASPPCVATDAELKQILVTTCRSLPGCTLAKETCQASDTCRSCWSTLRDRDPSGAVAECSSGTGKEELDVMVRQCVSGVDLSCTFWRARCEADPACRDCFDAMGSGSSPSAMIAGSTDPSCAATRESASSASALLGAFDSCPLTKVGTTLLCCLPDCCSTKTLTYRSLLQVNSCMARITGCVLGNARCAECLVTLNGGIPPGGSDDCAELLGVTGYDVDLACFCPETQVLDAVIVATSAVGSISVLACIAVILLVVAYDDHKKTLRSRIIIGLMASNVLYSLGNSIPPLYLTRNPVDCAYNELTFVLQRWERSLWVCGKFGSVLYELFIIGASTRALMTGAQLSAWTEGTMHFGCAAGAAMAFAAFYIPVSKIDETENRSNMFKALRNNFEHLGPSDDLNDDNTFGALIAFTNSRTHFNDVLQKFLLAWNAFVGLALLMWLIFRWKHLQLHWAWRREMTSTEVLESTDEWGKTRRSHWRDRRRVLDLQRRAYTEVARPLEPYVVVLLIFAIPGIVMTTPWCIKWSAIKVMHVGFAGARNSTGFYNTGDGQVLLCDSICELLLAFRSAATVAVFFSAHRHRREFVNVRETIRRLGRGLRYCLCCQQPSQTPQSELIEVTPAELPPAVLLTDADIELNTQLAEGANGAVWTGTWTGQPGHHVAIKVMSVRAFHDVDMIEDAQRDFITECDMLRRVRHPNVLKFYGAGRTAQGNGFIITELMTRGSLSAVLSDSSQPLDWPVRMSIALQVSSVITQIKPSEQYAQVTLDTASYLAF